MASNTNGSRTGAKVAGTTNGKIHVAVRDNEIVLNDFHETDPEVVALARQADDPEAAMHNAFEVGARAIKLAQVSQDTHVVESAFNEMRGQFDRKLEETLNQVGEATDALFDGDDGVVPQALQGFREELEGMLGDAFDPDSKRSIIGKFDALVRGLRKDEREAVRELLDPGNNTSPLHRLQRDLSKAVREEADSVRKLVGELSEKIAVSEAEDSMFEKTALKGGKFEDSVHALVTELVAPLGDVAEQTGTETGCAGTKKGDEVVTLNPEDTHGCDVRYTLEAKDRGLSMRATFEELDGAMENRDTEVAIAVFSCTEHAPTHLPFSHNGNKAVVVLDKDELDTCGLRLALMWARWMVQRSVAEDSSGVDIVAIQQLVDDAARALNRHATIKRCHSTAAKKISEAVGQVDDLVREVDEALERVRGELDKE
jgi:hypothetical protein